ncbi:MAG: hypothetical protein IJD73_00950 [Clostridia bacterium]|nr:hypothetical protein [Clostridia bacterium]
MKKIIKIAALILALLCIGTSLASCGESNQEMADNIRANIKIKYTYFSTDSTGKRNSEEIESFGGPELFNPNGYSLTATLGKNPHRPENFAKDYAVILNGEKRELIIALYVCALGKGYDGNNQFKITLPYKIKEASYGEISDDKKTLTAEFLSENIKTVTMITQPATWYSNEYTYEVENYYITQQIVIKY